MLAENDIPAMTRKEKEMTDAQPTVDEMNRWLEDEYDVPDAQPTPRTDAHYGRLPTGRQVRGTAADYKHAAELERELAAERTAREQAERVELIERDRATVAEQRLAVVEAENETLRNQWALVHPFQQVRIKQELREAIAALAASGKEKP